MALKSTDPGPRMWSCPTISSTFLGLILSANGALGLFMFNGSTYYTLLVSGKPRHWTGSESIGSAENDDSRHLNSKSEYRNPKQIQSINVPMLKTNAPSSIRETERRTVPFCSFGFWSFDIVSNFGFRDSNFLFIRATTPAPLNGVPSKPRWFFYFFIHLLRK